jgi:cytochrome c553
MAWLVLVVAASPALADDSPETFFELKVRPVLATECLSCHGGKKTSGGLSVATREALIKGGDRGPAIVVGDPDRSLLIQAIRKSHDEVRMPPEKRLSEQTVADVARWIAQGASWPSTRPGPGPDATAAVAPPAPHWAFEKVRAPMPPPDPTGWSAGPIDRFIAARRAAAGLRPVRRADRRTLIRRATFDLIGLPPSPGEIRAFLDDRGPDAYARLIDRLLASPHYGERWGRHWMDVAHYADTAGDNADYPVPEAVRYRDYIIDAFNRDKPYDRFVREQLAGDVLARGKAGPEYAESVAATGFLALSRRYATGPYELWHLTLEDAIETTGRAFLGLTLRCARCHDHKFDPVTQRDYYAFYGMFASTAFPYAGSEEFQSKGIPRSGFVPLVDPARAEPEWKAYRERMAELERLIPSIESAGDGGRLPPLKAEYSRLKRTSMPPALPAAYAVAEGKPIDVPLQRRGEPGSPGPVVPHGVPRFAFLAAEAPPPAATGSSGRYELAQWLTRPGHPLTARVMVNRIWQHHFGRGIVATPSNFGVRGEAPTHPELLDWLAATFVDDGWSIKALHREILLSETYQLASDDEPRNASLDPADRWLWRFPRRRLDAESIRDAMLAVSGRLDVSRPACHPFPPIEDWHWTQHDAFKTVYASDHRSVYLMTQRLVRHPFLALFDGPDTNTSTDVRSRSTVPLQALYFLNNPFVLGCAEGLAGRMIAAGDRTTDRIAHGFELAWGRPPEPDERDRAFRFVGDAASVATDREAWTGLARVLLTANEFLYID